MLGGERDQNKTIRRDEYINMASVESSPFIEHPEEERDVEKSPVKVSYLCGCVVWALG